MKIAVRWSFVIVIVCMIALSMVVLITIDRPDSSDEEEVARTFADELTVHITDPSDKVRKNLSSGNYEVSISNDTTFSYSVDVQNTSYEIAELTINWTMQTEHGFLNIFQPEITADYDVPGEYWISVNVTDDDNKTGSALLLVTVKLDVEDDGLPDWWERKYFDSINIADDTTDYDDDGMSDLEEYQKGTDPKVVNVTDEDFLSTYWWVIALIVIGAAIAVLYILMIRPKMAARRKDEEQRKIAAAIEIEKALEGGLEEKPRKK